MGKIVCFMLIISSFKTGIPEMTLIFPLLFWEIMVIIVHIFLEGLKHRIM